MFVLLCSLAVGIWSFVCVHPRFRPGALSKVAHRSPSPDSVPVFNESDLTAPSSEAIAIHGAREHNLKNLSLEIPRSCFVVVIVVSGSGKSTLAFDLLSAEGQRRFLDSMNVYARQFVEQL